MSNSKLVSYTKLSPNKTSPRNHIIDTITIHCYVGQVTVQRGCEAFANAARKASCNYVVAKDGQIGLVVDEGDRSWCSSNAANDHRAITIEVASETKAPYRVTDAAMNALIELVADICRRNDIKQLLWKADKSLIGKVDEQNMTVHRWFANKSCPGDYLYGKHGYIADEVNKRLGVQNDDVSASDLSYLVEITAWSLNVRKGPGTKYEKTASVKKKQVYTIVEEQNGWGKLKSGVGWISLKYTKRK